MINTMRIKLMLMSIFYWLSVPSLILHEIWHILFAYILGGRLISLRIYSVNKIRIKVIGLNNIFKVRLVAMAPFNNLIFSLILTFFFDHFYFVLFLYFLLTSCASLPSYVDFEVAELSPPKIYCLFMDESFESFLVRSRIEKKLNTEDLEFDIEEGSCN